MHSCAVPASPGPISRSEANDLALEICRAVTGGSEILVLDGAYHGVTPPLMALSTYKLKQQAGGSTIRVRLDPHAWVVSDNLCVCVTPKRL